MTEPYGGGAAAPYKGRKRRKLKKLAMAPRIPKPQVKQVGGGVAAPGPYTTQPVRSGKPMLTGRALAVTKGKGKKVGLKRLVGKYGGTPKSNLPRRRFKGRKPKPRY